jgi:hypothetical protein
MIIINAYIIVHDMISTAATPRLLIPFGDLVFTAASSCPASFENDLPGNETIIVGAGNPAMSTRSIITSRKAFYRRLNSCA